MAHTTPFYIHERKIIRLFQDDSFTVVANSTITTILIKVIIYQNQKSRNLLGWDKKDVSIFLSDYYVQVCLK